MSEHGEASARALVGGRAGEPQGAAVRAPAAGLAQGLRARALRAAPRAAWVCALVACLNAVCWSLITPPFEVPDEPSHFAYVKQLAETASLPTSSSEELSREERVALEGLRIPEVVLRPQNHPVASRAEQRQLERDLAPAYASHGSPQAGVASSQPPLYYAIEAIPYTIARGGNLLDRLALMRLFSALFAGLTAMFVFLFVREALPAAPWSWTVAGLAIALAPLLGFMSGSVDPDSMLFAVSAATFFLLARSFRRGFDARAAVALGAIAAIGLLTKVNYAGLVPGVALGLVVLSVRAARTSGRAAYGWLALALGIASSPVLVYAGVNALSNHPALGVVSTAIGAPQRGALLPQLDYVWQLFLPRLPGTADYFPGLFTTRQLWFDGYVGLYGWLDTPFPAWVENLALVPAGAILLLCGRALVRERAQLRRRLAELAVYATICLGLLVTIGLDSYLVFPGTDAEYAQVRYLLPLLALLGAVLALAARGAGPRWGRVVGILIVVLFLAHNIFSQLQEVARFYG